MCIYIPTNSLNPNQIRFRKSCVGTCVGTYRKSQSLLDFSLLPSVLIGSPDPLVKTDGTLVGTCHLPMQVSMDTLSFFFVLRSALSRGLWGLAISRCKSQWTRSASSLYRDRH
ncbi:hypothetical protein LIER_17276 [Lithospermum erythrorhizon]|uniref:Uncharacterized protein n=1 Tax=Lithospermum erythrorhizon TaxID=34254 RepID=A0AAV3Q9Q1_LITER